MTKERIKKAATDYALDYKKLGDHIWGHTIDSFIAGAEFAAAPVSCGWVKASERLPEFEKQVYIKDNVGCKRLGNFFENDFGVETLYICPNGAHEAFYIQAKDFWSIEWLSEPTLPKKDPG